MRMTPILSVGVQVLVPGQMQCEWFHIKPYNPFILLLVPIQVLVAASVNRALGAIPLGPIYTKRQRQCCDNCAKTLAILFSLKTMESLENGLQPHSGETPLFSMRTVSLASLQSCHSIDTNACYERALKRCFGQ